MRRVRKGFTPLLRHKSPWLDCFVINKLIGSSMYLRQVMPSRNVEYAWERNVIPSKERLSHQ
jgi:hypothetical protein